jgi:predicted outer membrane repeat protein
MGNGGGAIDVGIDSSLTVNECTFSKNTVYQGWEGGAIINFGALTINDSTFANNSAEVYGGAIYSTMYGTLVVNNSMFTGSHANTGGAIYSSGSLAMSNSTISGNSAGDAGGIFNGGTATVSNSILTGDSGGECGGIGCYANSLYFQASGTDQHIGSGWDSGTITVAGSDSLGDLYTLTASYGKFSTPESIVSGVQEWDNGGGIMDGEGLGTILYVHLANGASFEPFTITNSSKSFKLTPLAENLLLSGNGNVVGAASNLSALGNYGGPTQTMIPLPGSSAICAGSVSAVASGVTTDQRGYPRTTAYGGKTCVDSGAAQTNYAMAFTTEPPSTVTVEQVLAPAPVVALTESGNPAAAVANAVAMTDHDSALGGTTSANFASGSATFGNLNLASIESSDSLTATLALNPALDPPLSLAATSRSFNVHGMSQSIAFPAITGTHLAASTLNLSATASSGLAVAFASTSPTVCTVSGATASLIASGFCSIQASQGGNDVYSPAKIVSQSFGVGHAAQTITFAPIASQAVLTTVNLMATASSGLPVDFASETPAVCTVSGSIASLIAGGSCTINATAAGNDVYFAAPAVSQRFAVSKASQTIDFPTILAQTAGTTLNLSATASSGLVVSFASESPGVCTVSGSVASFIASGHCTIKASQEGNAQYAVATVSQSFGVNHASQTITFAPIATQTAATTLNLTASASSGLAVSFASHTPGVCTVSGASASLIAYGTCTIQASQAGNNVYFAASANQSFGVGHASQTITFAAIPSQTAGTTLNLSATASSSLAVSFASTTPKTCTVAENTASFIASGTCTIKATQAGNDEYFAAPPVSRSFTVTQ